MHAVTLPLCTPCTLPLLQHSVAGLVKLAACLPQEHSTTDVLPAFADLCTDQVWSVRQDCASELSNMAAELPRAAVRDQLLPLWAALAGDASAWVQAAARRQAGPLLAYVHPEDAPPGKLGRGVAGGGWRGCTQQGREEGGPASRQRCCACPEALPGAAWPQPSSTHAILKPKLNLEPKLKTLPHPLPHVAQASSKRL